MKKGRFLWSVHRITEKQKAGKARNIKEKQLKNSRNTASRQLVALPSSASAKLSLIRTLVCTTKAPKTLVLGAFFMRHFYIFSRLCKSIQKHTKEIGEVKFLSNN